MLEHLPSWLGALMRNMRAGHSKLAIVDPALALGPATIDLFSPAFANGARLPERFTADGEGVSPPLVWGPLPEGTKSLALIIEDPDAPALRPMVHGLIWGLPADAGRIAEGAIVADGPGNPPGEVGSNSMFRQGWLPPDPPNGHGPHDYVFQLFALDETEAIGPNPGRTEMIRAMEGKVLAAGLLVGTYSRGDPLHVGQVSVGFGVPA